MAANGMFEVDNLNDWQHSSMYLAFVTSGVIDLLGHFTKRLPAMAEQVGSCTALCSKFIPFSEAFVCTRLAVPRQSLKQVMVD